MSHVVIHLAFEKHGLETRELLPIPSNWKVLPRPHIADSKRMNFFADKAAVPDIRSREKEIAERIVK